MNKEQHKLDNPVWHSLNEIHQAFSIASAETKFYKPSYCPFGGTVLVNQLLNGIKNYSKYSDDFYVVGTKPVSYKPLKLSKNVVCNQMILEQAIDIKINENIIELKTRKQKRDLFELVTWIQPGYFNKNTPDLGRYFGIYKSESLIAVAGERMKMNKFTEISSVITHPNHLRMGYAKQLLKLTTDMIFIEDKTPYLHVVESNTAAIKLYEKLGFKTRRKINFWNLITTKH